MSRSTRPSAPACPPRAIAAHADAEAAHDEASAHVAASMAQLLEITAVARRARLQLAASERQDTAELLVRDLNREVDAVAAARAAVEQRNRRRIAQ